MRKADEKRDAGYSAQLAAAIFAASDEAMLITDREQIILSVNPAFERVTGYSAAEAIGRTPRFLSSGRHDPAFYSGMWSTILRTGHWRGEIWNRRKDGGLYAQRITISVLRGKDGEIVNYVAVFSDITDTKRESERIRHLASHDALTHLPNRLLLHDRLDQALAQGARNQTLIAVLLLDLDGFKEVNDQLGHLVGDRLLQLVAERLSRCVRDSDTVARLGGDEFVILLPEVGSIEAVEKLAAKLLSAMAEPFSLDNRAASIGVSIGIAVYPDDGASAEALLGAADGAMYGAKRQGKGRFVRAGRAT